MKRNRLFIGALVAIVAFVFVLGCGGGGDNENNNTATNHEYVIENLSLNLAEASFWSDNGSVLKEGGHEVAVFQDGDSFQSELKWGDIFPIQAGDQYDFSFNGEVVGGGEVTFRIVKKEDGKTKTIYSEVKFSFISGKNTIPTLTVNATDTRASVVMLFGKKAGQYKFLTPVYARRTWTGTSSPKTILNIKEGEFYSKSGSTWDPKTGIVDSKKGSIDSDTRHRWGGVPIKANAVHTIILTGYSMPVGDVVIQLRSFSSQTLGKRRIEFYGEEMVVKIVPTGSDDNGYVYILYPDAVKYHPTYLSMGTE